ncbi:DUF3887 domain-containing protein [Raoultibacter phocaeensis]|uniref:DUF3887 domain-containing protein n=1 Tax=Raoultibacter phocaeensis TaxID=2479841 RepID=UPI001117C80B|nr:DUF3887 domain-containing protein [Raoultibacter phocaeensis]
MKKRLGVLVTMAALACALCLIGCSSSGSGSDVQEGLPDWANETQLTEQTRELIDLYTARDFDAVAEKCEPLGLSAEDFAQNGDPILDQLGAFKDFGDVAYLNGKAKDGTPYATVVQIANYENGPAQYTISFNEDDSISGFYIK